MRAMEGVDRVRLATLGHLVAGEHEAGVPLEQRELSGAEGAQPLRRRRAGAERRLPADQLVLEVALGLLDERA